MVARWSHRRACRATLRRMMAGCGPRAWGRIGVVLRCGRACDARALFILRRRARRWCCCVSCEGGPRTLVGPRCREGGARSGEMGTRGSWVREASSDLVGAVCVLVGFLFVVKHQVARWIKGARRPGLQAGAPLTAPRILRSAVKKTNCDQMGNSRFSWLSAKNKSIEQHAP